MAMHKVVWQEGMLLRPQHFQQNDRYYDYQLKTRTQKLDSYAWGFFELEIDRQFLNMGKLVVSKASGVLPDGSLFDLGADLAAPETGEVLSYEPLRVIEGQVDRIEKEIDQLNADLDPLKSFILPGGTPAAAYLHLARTTSRRAERIMVELSRFEGETIDGALERLHTYAARFRLSAEERHAAAV